MKIGFRHLPFTKEQIQNINTLIEDHGHEGIWFSDDVPAAADLQDFEILMGYFPPALFAQLPALKWVQTPAAGVEKLCAAEYANPDTIVTNCSGAFGIAISEYAFTGLLMLMRLMPAYMENQKSHIWHCEGTCRSIWGSTITVVGMGDIGTNFARRAKAFGAHVRGVRRTKAASADCFDEVFTTDQLNTAVENADAVVLCLPGTNATTGLVDAECISHMGSQTILVNCGRGYTIDQDALTVALSEGRLAGAVLDVTATEPLPAEHPLWSMKNVIITPHISGHDDDPVNYASIYAIFMENLQHYFSNEPLAHVVDRKIGY